MDPSLLIAVKTAGNRLPGIQERQVWENRRAHRNLRFLSPNPEKERCTS